MADDYTPTEELILETLTARYRLGENLWTFSTRYKQAFDSLERKGLIYHKSGIVEKTQMVWFTDAGKAECLAYDYIPPIAKSSKKATKKAKAIVKQAKKLKKKTSSDKEAS